MALNITAFRQSSIRPVAAETKLPQDFHSDTAEETSKGTVVAVGNGTKEHTMTVK
jgi:chaperonin GroES